jgi:hypothetical protein
VGEWAEGEKIGKGWLKTEHSSIFEVKIENGNEANVFDMVRLKNSRNAWISEKQKRIFSKSDPQ